MKLTIKVSKYNEVSPKEISKLVNNGAEIIKNKNAIGVFIGEYTVKGKRIRVYSDDDIRINNVILPLSIGEDEYYSSELIIEV